MVRPVRVNMKALAIICCVLLAVAMASDDLSPEKLLHQGNVGFTGKLFQDVVKSKPNDNVVMSAYSVLTPLAQLSLAAEGNSQQELLTTLGLPNTNAVKEAFKTADKNLRSIQGVTLKTASRIYVAQDSKLKPEFNAVSRDIFDSDVANLNFANSVPAAASINEWVEQQTNNHIKNLVSPDFLDATTRAVLVNAIYFKGDWAKPFQKFATKNRDFFVTKDQKLEKPMMFQNDKFNYRYSNELKAQVLEMQYQKGEASFVVILPDEVDGVTTLAEKLQDTDVITKEMKDMRWEDVNVHLPKFKIETTIDLKEALQHIGLNKIFNPSEAHLSNLLEGNENLHISEAVQKAFIEVNEQGSEAAAANAFGISLTSAFIQPLPPKEFNANHPFVFAIKAHDEIIFSGVFRK